jgi:hypothetical protein
MHRIQQTMQQECMEQDLDFPQNLMQSEAS